MSPLAQGRELKRHPIALVGRPQGSPLAQMCCGRQGWIPAFAGMTSKGAGDDALRKGEEIERDSGDEIWGKRGRRTESAGMYSRVMGD